MKTKSTNFKFSKKPLKSIKISNDKTKKNTNDYYSKIIMNLLEPLKIKEESKNSNENHGQKKLKLINKLKFSSNNSSNKLLKITLNEKNKNRKNHHKDISNNNDYITKERKTANVNKKKVAKKIIQSISEKNIIKNNKNSEKNCNSHTTKELNSNKKKNNNAKMNYNDNCHIQKLHYNMINNNNNKERKNKSVDKRKERKVKNFSDKQSTINLKLKMNDIINSKKTCLQNNKQYNKKSNKASVNSSFNKRSTKINKIHRSPENLLIDISNGGFNFYLKEKNMNKTKYVNNANNVNNINEIISSSRLFNTKKLKKNTEHNSSKNIYDKNTKIKSIIFYFNQLMKNIYPKLLNKPFNQQKRREKNIFLGRVIYVKTKLNNLIEKKNIKNISSNSSNSKKNIAPKNEIIFKRIKVESIKIDLNLFKPQKNYSFISQEKTTAENPQINDKINLTLRETEFPKFSKFNNYHKNSELNIYGQTEMSDLNRSIKTSLSIYRARSLSKKREEKKRNKLRINLEDVNKNEEKLNNILRSLSNLKFSDIRNCAQKSEPKKLIDKIRKYKKLKQLE